MTERTPHQERIPTWVRAVLVLLLLYLFLVGVKALESGIQGFGEDFTDSLFHRVSNPLAGLFVGILATVLVQSSSVTTATIVGLVGSGSLSIELAVPMVMGANIGTTVTNTLASLGFLRRSKEFRLAFAGATMHDFFNLCNVALLMPIELATGFLTKSAEWLAGLFGGMTSPGVEQGGFIKDVVKAPVKLVERLLDGLGAGGTTRGIVLLVVGIAAIFVALAFVTHHMRLMMAGRVERSVNAVLSKGGGITAILIGVIMTVAVQSSSITTSVLIPMIAAGVITLRNAYPITLGANIGTTITALLASLATDLRAGLVIALVHTLFNVAGVAIWYGLPFLRGIPLNLAQRLARRAEVRKSVVIVYVVGGFVIIPIIGVLVLQ
ncbi:MAG: Na/Pi symporter [Actinobacteria bacterium]|nr:Na/Pi symporter [Actinomycetota bacterium]